MKEKFSKLEKILKINIKKKNLLSEAFTHKSANQNKNNESNARVCKRFTITEKCVE